MSKRSRNSSAANVQLFPFLAVLLCAMGGLIVLLVVITGRNRAVGKQLAEVVLHDRIALAAQRNELEWQRDFVAQARDNTAAQLSGRRAALAALESRSRAVREEIAELESAILQSQQEQRGDSVNAVELERRIAGLEAEAALKEKELQRLRDKAREFEDSYAVVPFEGTHSTRRRPMYIECAADAVILQPEGIRLIEDDFVFADGPNNALAAALRAGRDFIARHHQAGGKDYGEPYPLLLVRPDGIGAYYAARHAMTSWGAEFGYELIEQDWKVAYRPPEPAMALAMTRAVDDARARALALARAAPGLLDAQQRKIYRSAFSAGKISRDGGGGGDYPASGGAGGRGPFSLGSFSGQAGGGGGGAGGRAFGGGSRGGRGFGMGGEAYGSGDGSRSGDDPRTLPYGQIAAGGAATGGRLSPGGTGFGGDTNGGSGAGGGNSGAGEYPGQPGSSTGGATGSAPSGPQPGQGTAGGSTSGTRSGAGTGTGSASGNGATGMRPGESAFATTGRGSGGASGGGMPGGSSMGGNSGSPSGMGGGGGASGEGGGQSVSMSVDQSNPESASVTVTPQSLAKQRGRDWGLPEKARSAVPLTRPISVRVTAHELTLLSETGNPLENKTIRLGPKTEDSVDELVQKMWKHVESWNLAGQGMYWRPVIVAHVSPDGQQRFRDLEALMTDSGLEVTQKKQPAPRAPNRR